MILFFICSVISGVLYRMGGYGPPFNTKCRDLGVPTTLIIFLSFIRGWHWSLIPAYLLLFLALSYSFKKKGTEMKWYNYVFMGSTYALTIFPFVFFTNNLYGFIQRVVLVTILTILSSVLLGNDNLEEFMRGYIIIGSLPMIL